MKVFELDALTTQDLKRAQFRARGIELPSNLVLIPVDFERESVDEKLREAGLMVGGRTLVLLEGVLQYLNKSAVDSTFTTIRRIAGAGSRVVFDHAYSAVLRGEGNAYGQRRMVEGVKRFGESWQFGLDDDEVADFLTMHGLALVDRKNPGQLEDMNFRGNDGRLRGHVNGTQGIVTAELLA